MLVLQGAHKGHPSHRQKGEDQGGREGINTTWTSPNPMDFPPGQCSASLTSLRSDIAAGKNETMSIDLHPHHCYEELPLLSCPSHATIIRRTTWQPRPNHRTQDSLANKYLGEQSGVHMGPKWYLQSSTTRKVFDTGGKESEYRSERVSAVCNASVGASKGGRSQGGGGALEVPLL